jgi:uncharacterized ferredoxin-like protein
MTREDDMIKKGVEDIAAKMLVAARTAPKGRGQNNIVATCLGTEEIKKVSQALKALGERLDIPAFVRDAESILNAQCMILIGTRIKALGLKKCGMCGFRDCAEKERHPRIPCVFNTGDLGIAIGSAVSIAGDNRVDNRIMYTVGQAIGDLAIFPDDVRIVYGIPLSATSKNPFFDR